MTSVNWDDFEKSFDDYYKNIQDKLDQVRKNLSNKKNDQAIEQLKAILTVAPRNLEAKNLLIYCLKETGQNKDDVKTQLEAALEQDPDNVLTNFNMGEFYYEQKEYQKALEHYEKAHKGFPANARILYQLGLTHQKMKNFEAACDTYEKAIEADPKYRKPYINACILFDKKDDQAQIIKFVGDLQTNFPQSVKALNVATTLYTGLPEKKEDIEKNFKQVSSIDPNNVLNIYNQAVYFYTQNELEKSSQHFAKIVNDPSLKQMKTHPIRVFSEISLSLILEKQFQLKNATKHLMNVTDDLNELVNTKDLDSKIEELQKAITKRKISNKTSFMIDEGEMMGTKEVINAEELDPSPINKDLDGSGVSLNQSDLKISTLHFSKHSSSRPPESKSNLVFWDKVTCIKFLEEDPTNFEARLRLGMIHLEEKNYNEAKDTLLECLKIKGKPEEDYDNVYLLLSEASRNLEEYDMASEYINNISNRDSNVEALTEMAACAEKIGQGEEARNLYHKALALSREFAPLHRRYGWFLIKIGEISTGIEQLTKAYHLDPKNIKTHRKLGRAYLLSEDNRVDDAFKHFSFVHDSNGDDYIGNLGLGQVYERKGDYETALDFLRKAAEQPKADMNCYFFMGTVYSKLRDFKKCQEIFRYVLKNDPNHVEACVEIATMFTMLKEYEKAKKYFRHAIKINPENVVANLRYGKVCQVYLKDYEAAMECYQRILRVEPDHYKSYYQMGLILYEQKKINDAHECFKKALKANSKYAPAWKAVGILLFENNNIESALKYFEKAGLFDPKDLETKIYIGNCHYELQNHDMAIDVYQEVLKVEESADIHYNLANSFYMKNDLENAIQHYSASLRLNSGRGECWYNLGNAYCMKGQYEEAVDNFKRSIEIDPQNVAAYYNLGNAYLLLKSNQEAIKAFEDALKLDPSNNEWKLMLAGVYLEGHSYENVFKLVREVLEKEPNNLDAMMLLVQADEGNGEYQEALKRAKKIQIVNPNYEGIKEKIAFLTEKVK